MTKDYAYDVLVKGKPCKPTRHCAVGVYIGARKFQDGTGVVGAFGMIGLTDPCDAKVTARCQLIVKGQLTPYFWFACDNPEHRQNAGVIQHLDDNGNVIRTERFLPEAPAAVTKKPKRLKR